MAHLRRHLISLLLALAWLELRGAPPVASAVPPLEFTVFAAEPVTGVAYLPDPDSRPVDLNFYPTAKSPRHVHHGAGPLVFVAADGEVVAEVERPAQCRTALLLFAPAADPEGEGVRYDVQVLADDSAHVPTGSLVILNASGLELDARVDGRPVGVHSGLNPPVHLGESAEVRLLTRFRNRDYQSFAGTIALGASGRAWLILLPPYRAGSLEVQSRLLVD